MPNCIIKYKFIDKENGRVYKVGETVNFTKKRITEIKKVMPELIEEVKTSKSK